MLVCARCLQTVVFDAGGWIHREDSPDCAEPVVAWPPPDEDDEAESAA